MSKISGKETKPEIIVRKYLFSQGFRYRKNDKKLAGKPDIVLPKYKTVIFVHGCFWHSHKNCPKSALPMTNREFWETKIQRNVGRDKRNRQKLKNLGWKVITIWQCRIKNKTLFEKTMKKVIDKIRE
jgi:DNA mismatch endonuclease (patch repair protein)